MGCACRDRDDAKLYRLPLLPGISAFGDRISRKIGALGFDRLGVDIEAAIAVDQ